MTAPAVSYATVVGQVLKYHRKKAGMDQTAMAAVVGLKRSAWSRIERGEVALTVVQLALACTHVGEPVPRFMAHVDRVIMRAVGCGAVPLLTVPCDAPSGTLWVSTRAVCAWVASCA